MAQATFHFPRGFLWGTATASHQVEGNNTLNNWWAWEQQAGRIFENQKAGLACDWWSGRWREDFDRAADMGQNAHRLSLEWSRIQPAPNRWDEGAIDRYREIVRGLVERDLTPCVTLHHFTDPLWIYEQGGWENEKTPEHFERYVTKVAEALKEYVSLWVTINEPNTYLAGGYVLGFFPPGVQSLGTALRAAKNMLAGHARAYHALHAIQPEARVGMAINYRAFLPARDWSPFDRWAAGLQSQFFNEAFPLTCLQGVVRLPFWRQSFPQAKGTQDYLGMNYYTQELISFNLLRPGELFARRFYDPEAELSSTGFLAHQPQGMFHMLRWANQFGLPIIIMENGIEDSGDDLRSRYIIEHLHQVWRAVNFNFPIKGYFYWTLVDNFEWERGWSQRFGLWELDMETQARRKRASADLYAEICRENGISSEMVVRYAPALLDKMFPG